MNSKLFATMAVVSATEITFDASLKCGKCIKGGFIYCLPDGSTDGEVVANGDAAPAGTCAENVLDAAYKGVCSDSYSDTDYAKGFCPQKQDTCGSNQEIEFTDVTEEGEEVEIAITGLTDGETCTYKLKCSKGSPAFKLKDESTTDDTKVEITYIEFEGDKVEKSETYDNTSSDKSPKEGMPTRDQTFEDSGDQGTEAKGGQKKPPRRKGDGSKTEGESIDEEKVYLEEKNVHDEEMAEKEEEKKSWFGKGDEEEHTYERKPRPEEGESMEDTTATEGYGAPTKGKYNADDKGYKTFGTIGQGENKEGAMDTDSSEESERTVQISVVAL